jgi:hypothetical protein
MSGANLFCFLTHASPILLILRLPLPFPKNYYLYPGKTSAVILFTVRLRLLIISTLDADIMDLCRFSSFGFVKIGY